MYMQNLVFIFNVTWLLTHICAQEAEEWRRTTPYMLDCIPQSMPSNRQSPIDLSRAEEDHNQCSDIFFYGYFEKSRNFTFRNNGKTIRIETDEKSFTVGGPLNNVYKFSQLHFHWGRNTSGSEHVIRNKRYALEIHLVHYNAKYSSLFKAMRHPDGLAVVAVLANGVSQQNESLTGIVDFLEKVYQPRTEVKISSSHLAFLRPALEAPRYYTYNGSLTNYPFCENVQWIVLEQPISIWSGHKFRSIKSLNDLPIVENSRSIQTGFNGTILLCGSTYKQEERQETAPEVPTETSVQTINSDDPQPPPTGEETLTGETEASSPQTPEVNQFYDWFSVLPESQPDEYSQELLQILPPNADNTLSFDYF